MDILKSLTNLLKRRKTLTPDDVPEGFCLWILFIVLS